DFVALAGAGGNRFEHFRQIVGDECDKLKTHGRADIADLACVHGGGLSPSDVACTGLAALLDFRNEAINLGLKPVAKTDFDLVDGELRAFQGLFSRHTASTTRHFLKIAVDEKYIGVVLGLVCHHSRPLRADLKRLSISLWTIAGPLCLGTG